jgi:chemotaxis methyl-accepting protein methylase
MRDCLQKIKLAYANSNEDNKDNRTNAIAAKISSLVSKDHGETFGVICNKLRNVPKAEIKNTLQKMVEQDQLILDEYTNAKGRLVKKYFCR